MKSSISNTIRRHQLIWINLEKCRDSISNKTLKKWFEVNRPCIVRRPCLNEAGALCVGVPLPPSNGKLRLTCEIPTEAVTSDSPPPLLHSCLAALPASERTVFEKLADEVDKIDCPARVVGSLAWQHLTNLNYLTTQSDIDLLFITDSQRTLTRLDKILGSFLETTRRKCDIEIMTPDGNGFLWKEYKQSNDQLLVKGNTDVFMSSAESLLS